ncbi:ABC-2 type transport system permease protein [Nakamurella panacisegetis]|uniref:ABC-2 type transport system permease protein n=1 Tax=Nakamurella panacisegetis TaxID=1090615 RepID=A0A1H0RQ85_9ACTN|nr:ABC transporter permease [Nakamurella panacisegetis]SDP31672.1 ABC-2 type transport system permease protein [Nakamurella panacisegetis]
MTNDQARPGAAHRHDHSGDVAASTMASMGPPLPATASGVPAGYRAGHTLTVRVELMRQLRRRRTQLSLGFMVILPLILLVAFSFGSSNSNRSSTSTSFVDLAKSGAGNFALVALFFSASFLLIVVISLFFGDTIASEASWSSLRYLLAMPVPRVRLLRQKILVAGFLSVSALVILPTTAYVVGLIAYGSGPLSTPIGDQFDTGTGLLRLLVVVGYLAVQLTWVAGLAFLLSVVTDAPLGAVGGAVLLSILSQILDQITALGGIRNWLPTHYSLAWTGAVVDPIRWDDMIRGAFAGLAYALVFVLIATLRFRRKDITS